MAEDLEIVFNTWRFNNALSIWAEDSKKTNAEILEQQARLFVKEVAQITPPGKEGVSGLKARKLGDASVEGDLRRLFYPVKKSEADPVTLATVHKQNRNRKGRVSKRVGKVKVYKADFNRYLREQKAKVGYLAAGWNKAAEKLGWNPPAWIKRHSSPGNIDVDTDGDTLSVKMKNAVRYASEQKGLERRIYRALKKKENDLVRQVTNRLKEKSPFQ